MRRSWKRGCFDAFLPLPCGERAGVSGQSREVENRSELQNCTLPLFLCFLAGEAGVRVHWPRLRNGDTFLGAILIMLHNITGPLRASFFCPFDIAITFDI